VLAPAADGSQQRLDYKRQCMAFNMRVRHYPVIIGWRACEVLRILNQIKPALGLVNACI